jgi:hypothetical protein
LWTNDRFGIHVKVFVDTLSVHIKTLGIFVEAHPLKVSPIDVIEVEWLRFTAYLFELAVQPIGAKSSLTLPAEVGIHIQSIVATESR